MPVYFPRAQVGLDIHFAGPGRAVHQVELEPKRLWIDREPYWQSDVCKLDVDYRVFPFDPRLADQMTVKAWMGDIQDPEVALTGLPAEMLRFLGFADGMDWQVGDSNTISVEARDLSGVLRDIRWPGGKLELDRPLDELLRSVLKSHTSTSAIQVAAHGLAPDDIPVPGASRGEESQAMSFDTSQSLWAVIMELCLKTGGYVAWIDGGTLLFGPTQSRAAIDGASLFIYGHNISRLRIERPMQGRRVPPVRVLSYAPSLRAPLEAVYPKEDSGDSETGLGTVRERRPFVVHGIANQTVLDRYARNTYERLAQNDVLLELQTREMKGFDKEDLLSIRAGSPIRIELGAVDSMLQWASRDERKHILLEQGYDPQVASTIANQYEEILPYYSVVRARHQFDCKRGYQLLLKAGAYIPPDGPSAEYGDVSPERRDARHRRLGITPATKVLP